MLGGSTVPRDVSIVGFDDVPEASYLLPPLTTVRQDFAALGGLIMQKVLIAIEEPENVTVSTPLPTRLVVRSRRIRSPDEQPLALLSIKTRKSSRFIGILIRHLCERIDPRGVTWRRAVQEQCGYVRALLSRAPV